MQAKFVPTPRFEFFQIYRSLQILPGRVLEAKSIQCVPDLSSLAYIRILRARPLKEYLGDACVRHPVVTLATHQEKVGLLISAAKAGRTDMATLERNFIPAA